MNCNNRLNQGIL